jgi:uncharacterized protein (DUF1919 family)
MHQDSSESILIFLTWIENPISIGMYNCAENSVRLKRFVVLAWNVRIQTCKEIRTTIFNITVPCLCTQHAGSKFNNSFFKLFISNQSYITFYKLICRDSL